MVLLGSSAKSSKVRGRERVMWLVERELPEALDNDIMNNIQSRTIYIHDTNTNIHLQTSVVILMIS